MNTKVKIVDVIEAARAVEAAKSKVERMEYLLRDLKRELASAEGALQAAKVPPTWKNTLTNQSALGDMDSHGGRAEAAGYRYYAWNGRLYLTECDVDLGFLADFGLE